MNTRGLKRTTIIGALAGLTAIAGASHAVNFPNVPLSVRVNAKPNVLFILDNSNSMDEAPNGSAVGSDKPASKSEIARRVARSLVVTYTDRINLGLMAYQQKEPFKQYLHNSPYDVSYNPANYDPSFNGNRASTTKRYRAANPASVGDYVYFNVALPYYGGAKYSSVFCYSATATAAPNPDHPDGFNNGENPSTGPWDTYSTYGVKTGTSDAAPPGNGYASFMSDKFSVSPTDSDLAQGIVDFGTRMAFWYVGDAWFRNDSPGRGYLHVPIKPLDGTQAGAIVDRLACNIPGTPGSCTSNGIPNAGLTPIEGTLLTAKDYFSGGWKNAKEGYTNACYPLPEACGLNFVIMLTDGLPSVDKDGGRVTNPSVAITAAANAAAALKNGGVETYVVGFALPYGTDPATLDAIASSGGTGHAFNANDETSLQHALDDIFNDIMRKVGSASNVATNSSSLNDGTRVFQATFNSLDWSGELMAQKLVSDSFQVVWHASAGIPKTAADRNIWTRNDATGLTVRFSDPNSLSVSQQSALGSTPAERAEVINYLRGDSSREVRNGGAYRNRPSMLGDIVDSSPYYVAATNTVYFGANDGMLHAVDAGSGAEVFAYVPSSVLLGLKSLTSPTYNHQFSVDGEIAVSGNLLVAALGRGGKGLFALNVANPAGFSASSALWEYTGAGDATHGGQIGYVLGRPQLVEMNDGNVWLIVGNGYNSDNGRAVLFIINPTTGTVLRAMDTGVGGDNGLASPGLFDADGNGTIDYAYAGDRKGNVWKFDLRSHDPAGWAVALSGQPLFTAANTSSQRQPVTTQVTIAKNDVASDPNYGKTFVFFGTGSYMSDTDAADKTVQSWYGLIDSGGAISGRATLRQRGFVDSGAIDGKPVRVFSAATANDMKDKDGWYIDLNYPGAQGERIVTRSLRVDLTVEPILETSSIIPNSAQCAAGGTGYLNAINPFTGARPTNVIFDVNHDGLFNSSDKLNGFPVGSVDLRVGLPAEVVVLQGGGGIVKNIVPGSNTSIATMNKQGKTSTTPRRISWREIVKD